jgi:rare lipoprotein A (peptidoglycan hydrolase)
MRNFISTIFPHNNSLIVVRCKKFVSSIKWQIIIGLLLIIMLFTVSLNLNGEDIWNGNATTIRKGEFDSEGLFAASNSFPLNSKILITNLANGKSSTVTIRKRIPDSSNMFLLLSDEAARDLEMGTYDVVNVEVRVISYGVDEIIGLPDDLPYNPDPDFWMGTPRPISGYTPSPIPEYPVTPSPPPVVEPTPEATPEPTPETTLYPCDETPEPTPETTPESSPEATLETTPETTPEETPLPTPEPVITPEPIGRVPQKNLYLLPHEDERFMALDYKTFGKDVPDASKNLSLNEAGIDQKKTDKPVEGGIGDPKKMNEKQVVTSKDLKDPAVESPQILDYTPYAAYEDESQLIAALPPVREKQSLVPEYSSEGYPQSESVIALEPTEPLAPSAKTGVAEVFDEYPRVSETEMALSPDEPSIQDNRTRGEVSDTAPRVGESEIALEPGEPDIESKKTDTATPTDETPKIKEAEGDHVAVEPDIRDKTKDTGIEPTNGTGIITGETEIILIPTEMRPPEKIKDESIVAETTVLAKNSYFVQIGSFTDKSVAYALRDKYLSVYPVVIFSPEASKLKIYNVLIGPLNKPESDTLFFRFKANGIKDAFVKYVQ